MAARIFKRSKNAMQSGKARADEWVLDFESHQARRPDPLTGWSGGSDPQSQVTLTFDSLEAARAYAERYNIACHVIPPSEPKLRIQSYADNFR